MNLRSLTDDFLRVLSEAQKLRSQKSRRIGDTLEWVLYERQVMIDLVNAMRLHHAKQPIDPLRVLQAERCATGHVDYSRKFALYCAELALEG